MMEGCAEGLNVTKGGRSVRCLRTAAAAKVWNEARAAEGTMPPGFIKVKAA
jgi:hypothetical protein